MKVREPVARPLDVVAAELLLSAAQAFLVGVLLYIAIGVWDDRGVAVGSVAVILALLGLVIGGAWLFWLVGGMGWPMAAANVPAAMFLGFAMVLGWAGDDLFRVDGTPLLVGVLAAVYGVVGGAFLDSPRRWRWDQRLKPRAGVRVPRVSPTTRALVGAVPRSLPRPSTTAASTAGADPAGPVPSAGPLEAGVARDAGGPAVVPSPAAGGAAEPGGAPSDEEARPGAPSAELPPGTETPKDEGTTPESGAGTTVTPEPSEASPKAGPIELPTSVEPRAQRSPWAWAAPPEWSRDEDDEPPGGRSSGRR